MVESQDTSLLGRPAAGRPERVCFVLHVKPHRLDEYKARHREVWPEMRADRSLERLAEVFHVA